MSALKSMQALGRLKTGTMNKTEAAYDKALADRKHAGEIAWYRFEGVKLRLADNTFYTPDFAVMLADGAMECHEVKGFWQDDARAKIKIAADQYPFRFVAVKAKTKKDGGGWAVEEF
jgi:L-asparaginase II